MLLDREVTLPSAAASGCFHAITVYNSGFRVVSRVIHEIGFQVAPGVTTGWMDLAASIDFFRARDGWQE